MWKMIMRSGYNFAHAITAELSWHVQNCDMIKFYTRVLGSILQIMYDIVKIHADLMWKIIVRSGYNFAHAITAELSWHVQNCDMIKLQESLLEQIFTRFLQDWNDVFISYF